MAIRAKPKLAGTINLGFRADGVADKDGATAKPDTTVKVRVREFFPETLYTNPALITGADGKARVTVPGADSITTWRVAALANSADGQLGSTVAPLRVFQDFFVDLDLPVAMTKGDEVEVPVAVYNYLPGAQKIILRLQTAEERDGKTFAWFDLVDDTAQKEITLKRDEVSVVHFRVKVKEVGVHAFVVRAYGSQMNDAVRRQIEIIPDGQERRDTINDRLDAEGATAKLTIPEAAIAGTGRIVLKLYPGIFSQVVEGLDSILRMPNGCFEQTTSSNYPNVLVLDYMKQTKKLRPEIQLKAESYANLGYQRLLTFQSMDGGFSLWSGGQPETFLTAFGMLQMADQSRVVEVDPTVISRAQAWLLKRQNADGTWDTTATAHRERASASGKLAFTAYAAWALAESRQAEGVKAPADLDAGVKKAADYLKAHLDDVSDDYLRALVANALVAMDPTDRVTQRVLQALADAATEEGKVAFWKSKLRPEFTRSHGIAAELETTALAAYALIRGKSHGALVSKALTYLVRNKDSFGNWHSTQATILSLKALLAAQGASLSENDGTVEVVMNGKPVGKLSITPENSDVLQQLDLTPQTQTGENTIELKTTGKISALYQVVGIYYLPWDQVKRTGEEAIAIDVDYDRTELKTNDTITATVKVDYRAPVPASQVVLDLGIPPGFQVQSEDLAEAVGSGKFKRFDLTGRQIIVYMGEMQRGKPVVFTYRLKAKFPVRAKTPRSVAYEYYAPQVRAVAPPVSIVVN